MKITLLQRNIVWADPQANMARNDSIFQSDGGSDLYIFPEMFSTGFCTVPEGIAEPLPSATLGWMKDKASRNNCAIAGSVAVQEDGKYFNRFYFVHPDGTVDQYDKRHLFTYGGEHLRFTAGSERTVVVYKGWRILLEICYDLRFPVWSRNRGDYDMIIYVASWPKPRTEAWRQLLRARAIENQCYVAAVNQCGPEVFRGGSVKYCGMSAVFDPWGEIVAECPPDEENLAFADIDLGLVDEIRARIPVFSDRRPIG